ncbi:hypothetical protein HanRHA438_Chr13g0628381 [Helianthus annuus]|nr:hypothetical protein HanRHA438_Chr13g0628381 [Helianthus annuus]
MTSSKSEIIIDRCHANWRTVLDHTSPGLPIVPDQMYQTHNTGGVHVEDKLCIIVFFCLAPRCSSMAIQTGDYE